MQPRCSLLSLRAVCWASALSTFLSACSGDSEPAKSSAAVLEDAAAPSLAGPTFHDDVAPILHEHCSICHSPGGVGPVELNSYEQVKGFGALVKHVTETRQMPPFLPDNSGACATYFDANVLSDEQIATIGSWVENGMPEGEPGEPREPREPPALDDPTHVAEMAETYEPDATLADDYRCFIMNDDLEAESTRYVTDFEVVPGDQRVVHHVVVYQARDQAGTDQAQALDAADEAMGYSCFGGAGVRSARMLMNWAPGSGVVHHPAGTGVPIEPGQPLIMQVHYNLAQGSLPDLTRILMKIEAEVPYPMTPWFYSDGMLDLPPGQEVEKVVSIPFEQVRTFLGETGTGPMTIMGVRAHMHTLGTKMTIERTALESGETACLANIPRYNFHWQRSYFLKQPVPLMPGDTMRVSCTYDTSSRTTPTAWGEGTQDEMCLATVYTVDGDYQPPH